MKLKVSDYKEHIFKELSETRKAQIILAELKSADECWGKSQFDSHISIVRNYVSWLNTKKISTQAQKLNQLSHLLENTNQKKLLDFTVAVERFLNIATKDTDILKVTSLDKELTVNQTQPLYLVLDHLRSAFNVGSIFRTAECLGVKHIYLIGYTPTPDDQRVQKTSMGTSELIHWSHHKDLKDAVKELKSKNIPIVGLETSPQAVALNKFKAPDSLALVLGNERFGLSSKDLEKLDHILEIPMLGQKNSLNVSNALSIAAYEITKQWKSS